MSQSHFHINNNVGSRLDWSIVGKATLPFRGSGVWIFFGNRPYARNARSNNWVFYNAYILFAALGLLFFHYIPFLYMGGIALLATSFMAMFMPVHYANIFRYGGIFNIIIGLAGLYFKIDLGLHIFSYNLNHYYFDGFLLGGALALYRRLWNAYVWNALDRFVVRYYKKYKISMDVPPEMLTDFKTAYFSLASKVSELMDLKFNHPEVNNLINDQTLEHFNTTIDLIEQEIQACRS